MIHRDFQSIYALSGGLRRSLHQGEEMKPSKMKCGFDSREPKQPIAKPPDMYEPDLHIDSPKIHALIFC